MSTDDPMREFVRRLFKSDEDDQAFLRPPSEEADEQPSGRNVVAQEGTTPPSPPRDQMRDFVADLFGRDPY